VNLCTIDTLGAMSQDFYAEKLDIVPFAAAAASLEARSPLAAFPRLMAELKEVERHDDMPFYVHWKAVGRAQAVAGAKDVTWLDLDVSACIPQICQRCLRLAQIALAFDRAYRFVATEKQAAEEDEMAEEDVLAVTRSLDLMTLIEDEMLMSMPLIPMHEVCPVTLPTEASDANFEEGDGRRNPFGALAGLKKVP
jgi:uncharacterized protein